MILWGSMGKKGNFCQLDRSRLDFRDSLTNFSSLDDEILRNFWVQSESPISEYFVGFEVVESLSESFEGTTSFILIGN